MIYLSIRLSVSVSLLPLSPTQHHSFMPLHTSFITMFSPLFISNRSGKTTNTHARTHAYLIRSQSIIESTHHLTHQSSLLFSSLSHFFHFFSFFFIFIIFPQFLNLISVNHTPLIPPESGGKKKRTPPCIPILERFRFPLSQQTSTNLKKVSLPFQMSPPTHLDFQSINPSINHFIQ
ncbi:hypothetical protein GGR50DRAFT_654298 [Xylaria sp. CBS 124048]|nr:hypothetical protein GGR50DRAFT_654298 [Xylaria sp. CBS 124048]